ncbi:MAG: AAA family ATPase [Thermostichales cyanobacterium SRBZ-1_bins_19]
MTALIHALQQPQIYPHPVQEPIQVIQTHISWIFLTGEFAYKIKKPMDFGFLDFTTLEKRRHFCQEELRLNQRGAADLYLEVVPITQTGDQFAFQGSGTVVEYALKMRQFPQETLLTRYFERGELTPDLIQRLGRHVADYHLHTPTNDYVTSFGRVAQVRQAFDENYAQTRTFIGRAQTQEYFEATQAYTDRFFTEQGSLLEARMVTGKIRECHGDLHLGNICYWQGRFYLFDCIEFNEPFRFVDVMYDIAYGVMDLQVRHRPDLANLYLNTYLEWTGDWAGVLVLRIYLIRQAYVRAKVNSFLLDDPHASSEEKAAAAARARPYYHLAWSYTQPQAGSLIVMAGLSGSGKSTVARYLAQHYPAPFGAIHIRSDALRKHLGGMPLLERGPASLYSADMTAKTYSQLLELGLALAQAGYAVILDGKYDRYSLRQQARQAAQEAGIPIQIIYCHAPEGVIHQRLQQRQGDVADAGVELMELQQQAWEPFTAPEQPYVLSLDTSQAWEQVLDQFLRQWLTT